MCIKLQVCVTSEHANVCAQGCLFVIVYRLNININTAVPDLHTSNLHLSLYPGNQHDTLHAAEASPPPPPTHHPKTILSVPTVSKRLHCSTVLKHAPPPWPLLLETALLTCCPIVSSGDGWGAASGGAILHSIAAPSVDCVTLGYKRGFYSVCAGCERSYLRGLSE